MKMFKTLFAVSVLALGIQQSQAVVYSSGSLNQTIPDGSATGLSSTLNVISTFSEITGITVTLNISGGFNGDLYCYLTHDNQTSILLNRIGTTGTGTFGNSGAGMNVTFVTSGAENIHDAASGFLSGNYLADGRYATPTDLAAVAAASSSTHTLNNFIGHGPSGNWTLFIADVDGGGVATLDSWSMDITAVPEPANVALGIFGGLFATWQGARAWKKKRLASV